MEIEETLKGSVTYDSITYDKRFSKFFDIVEYGDYRIGPFIGEYIAQKLREKYKLSSEENFYSNILDIADCFETADYFFTKGNEKDKSGIGINSVNKNLDSIKEDIIIFSKEALNNWDSVEEKYSCMVSDFLEIFINFHSALVFRKHLFDKVLFICENYSAKYLKSPQKKQLLSFAIVFFAGNYELIKFNGKWYLKIFARTTKNRFLESEKNENPEEFLKRINIIYLNQLYISNIKIILEILGECLGKGFSEKKLAQGWFSENFHDIKI